MGCSRAPPLGKGPIGTSDLPPFVDESEGCIGCSGVLPFEEGPDSTTNSSLLVDECVGCSGELPLG